MAEVNEIHWRKIFALCFQYLQSFPERVETDKSFLLVSLSGKPMKPGKFILAI